MLLYVYMYTIFYQNGDTDFFYTVLRDQVLKAFKNIYFKGF